MQQQQSSVWVSEMEERKKNLIQCSNIKDISVTFPKIIERDQCSQNIKIKKIVIKFFFFFDVPHNQT